MATSNSTGRRARILKLTRKAYREFHHLVKREAGACLQVSSYEKLGKSWGVYDIWALSACRNALAPADVRSFDEVAMISLADRINLRVFRACARPELDWSAIPDERVYEFIVWHEIGHRRDNFDMLDFMVHPTYSEPHARKYWHGAMRRANEVLADRFAWEKCFPGQPMAISEKRSPEYLQVLNDDIEHLSRDFPRGKYALRPLPSGFAEYVPTAMIQDKRLAAFTGVPHIPPRPQCTEMRNHEAHRLAYEEARIGPKRPVLELIDGWECGFFSSVQEDEPRRLMVGRRASQGALKKAASQYGFLVYELVKFQEGGALKSPAGKGSK